MPRRPRPQRRADRRGEIVERRLLALLAGGVGDRQPAAGAQFARDELVAVAHRRGEAAEGVDRPPVRLKVEDLRADVRVEAEQVQPRRRQRAPDRRRRPVAENRQPELRVGDPRLPVLVRVRLHAGVEAQQDRDAPAPAPGGLLAEGDQPVEFERVVDDDPPDPRLDRQPQLLRPLVVAVEDDPLRREAAAQRQPQLAARHHVEPQPLLAQDRQDRRAEVGFGGVDDLGRRVVVGEGGAVAAAAVADRRLVVDVERRPPLAGQRDEIDAVNREVARRVGAGGERPEHRISSPACSRHGPEPGCGSSAPGHYSRLAAVVRERWWGRGPTTEVVAGGSLHSPRSPPPWTEAATIPEVSRSGTASPTSQPGLAGLRGDRREPPATTSVVGPRQRGSVVRGVRQEAGGPRRFLRHGEAEGPLPGQAHDDVIVPAATVGVGWDDGEELADPQRPLAGRSLVERIGEANDIAAVRLPLPLLWVGLG